MMSFLSFFLWISLKDLPFKQTRSRRWLRWKAGWGRWARRCEFCSPNLSVCFPLPAPEHRACKSFSCTALSQPLLAPFQKCAACFRKMEGTSLHGECCLPALVTTALALSLSLSPSVSFPLFLSQTQTSNCSFTLCSTSSVVCLDLWNIMRINTAESGRKHQLLHYFLTLYIVLHFRFYLT